MLMGRPAIESSALLIEKTGIPMSPSELREAMAKRQTELFPHVKPMPGAERLVQHLSEAKIPMAVRAYSIHSLS